MTLNRRHFLGATAALSASLAAPTVWGASHGRPKVVVIGGGAGGATVARYIAKDSDGGVDVTLIEPTRTYYTCFFSNLYIGGFRDFESIGHSYGGLASDYGVNVVHDWATGVDRDTKTVTTAGGNSFAYDALVVSPGIDFVEGSVPGWDVSAQNKMPHAGRRAARPSF
jgi:sulfide dehydrogenase [flavocytochrome c] flavoprotein subunit